MFFDTHSHLNFPAFAEDLDQVVARAREKEVTEILVVGTSRNGTEKALAVADRFSLWAAAGIHPSEADKEQDGHRKLLALARHARVVAIGETGLDYTYPVSRKTQQEVFQRMVGLARELSLPVIVHSREAAADTFSLLQALAADFPGSQISGVWHCFSGDQGLAEKVLSLGLHVSFTGNVTYRGNQALRRTMAAVPVSRLLLETDCPFLPPEGKRGERNEPAWLPLTLKVLAREREANPAALAHELFQNSCRLFLKEARQENQ